MKIHWFDSHKIDLTSISIIRGDNMDKNKKIAFELAKILIQKDSVIPISTMSSFDSSSIEYKIGNKNYTFFEIVSHFLDCINNIEEYL